MQGGGEGSPGTPRPGPGLGLSLSPSRGLGSGRLHHAHTRTHVQAQGPPAALFATGSSGYLPGPGSPSSPGGLLSVPRPLSQAPLVVTPGGGEDDTVVELGGAGPALRARVGRQGSGALKASGSPRSAVSGSEGGSSDREAKAAKDSMRPFQRRHVALLVVLNVLAVLAFVFERGPGEHTLEDRTAPDAGAYPSDKGDTAWMLFSSALVMIMTPGLSLFYGGMVRACGRGVRDAWCVVCSRFFVGS